MFLVENNIYILNDITDELCMSPLVAVLGEAACFLICVLSLPEHPEAESFDKLVLVIPVKEKNISETLKAHLQNLKRFAATCNK